MSVATPILHVDMDAFYASVEVVRRPELRGLPVVVGGGGARGVVAAASYEARAFGIHSAMPSTRARRLCPDAVFLPGDHTLYREVSRRVMEVFRDITPLVEPVSLDEAFLDVGGAERTAGTPTEIAGEIRAIVAEREHLDCSVGVAPNKFLAKLASGQAKPRVGPTGPEPGQGVCVVGADAVEEFLAPLPVGAVWGVAPRTLQRLRGLGVSSVGDLVAVPEATLVTLLGEAAGRHLWRLARGVDDRPVEPDQRARSIGHEETFATDLADAVRLRAELVRMADAVASRLREAGVVGRTVTLKVRFSDFETVTRSLTLVDPTDSGAEVAEVAAGLLARLDLARGVRLLGVSLSSLADGSARQLRLDEVPGASWSPGGRSRWREAERAVDMIRDRFGEAAIGRDPARG